MERGASSTVEQLQHQGEGVAEPAIFRLIPHGTQPQHQPTATDKASRSRGQSAGHSRCINYEWSSDSGVGERVGGLGRRCGASTSTARDAIVQEDSCSAYCLSQTCRITYLVRKLWADLAKPAHHWGLSTGRPRPEFSIASSTTVNSSSLPGG